MLSPSVRFRANRRHLLDLREHGYQIVTFQPSECRLDMLEGLL